MPRETAPSPEDFGRYRIHHPLGRGGMGEVVLAEDTKLGRRVALKFPQLNGSSSGQVLKRFLQEAQTAAALNHPGICAMHDIGKIDGRPFISMEYVEGVTLDDWYRGQPVRKIAAVVARVAKAVQVAHERGIVHRDLKPSNVMIRPNGQPVVMDFGLAVQTESDNRITGRAMMGTLAYAAPEQLENAAKVEPSADVYALGVLLYELLTDRVPYDGENALGAKLQGVAFARPSEIRPGIPGELEALCLRMLRFDPRKRPDVGDVQDELSNFVRRGKQATPRTTVTTAKSPATTVSYEEPPPTEPIRPRWPWMLLGGLGTLLCCGLVLVIALGNPKQDEPVQPPKPDPVVVRRELGPKPQRPPEPEPPEPATPPYAPGDVYTGFTSVAGGAGTPVELEFLAVEPERRFAKAVLRLVDEPYSANLEGTLRDDASLSLSVTSGLDVGIVVNGAKLLRERGSPLELRPQGRELVGSRSVAAVGRVDVSLTYGERVSSAAPQPAPRPPETEPDGPPAAPRPAFAVRTGDAFLGLVEASGEPSADVAVVFVEVDERLRSVDVLVHLAETPHWGRFRGAAADSGTMSLKLVEGGGGIGTGQVPGEKLLYGQGGLLHLAVDGKHLVGSRGPLSIGADLDPAATKQATSNLLNSPWARLHDTECVGVVEEKDSQAVSLVARFQVDPRRKAVQVVVAPAQARQAVVLFTGAITSDGLAATLSPVYAKDSVFFRNITLNNSPRSIWTLTTPNYTDKLQLVTTYDGTLYGHRHSCRVVLRPSPKD